MTQALDPPAGLGGDSDDRIVLRGIVDGAAGAQLGVMLAERVAGGVTMFDLDLSAVEAIDEQGLVAIVRLWHEVSTCGRSMRLLDPSPAVGPLLDMTGLTASYTDR